MADFTYTVTSGVLSFGAGITNIGTITAEDKLLIVSTTIPSTVLTIDADAFKGCINMTTVSLASASAITDVGASAFEGCVKLTGLDFSACVDLDTIGAKAFYGCSKLATADFSTCVAMTSIGASAFEGCVLLEELDFSACVLLASLGDKAFYGCSKLALVKLKGTLITAIGVGVFENSGIEEVTLGEVTSIGNYAFRGCKSLLTFTCPITLKTISTEAFACTGIKTLVCNEGLTTIYPCAFIDSKDLAYITVPDTVTMIGYLAFTSKPYVVNKSLIVGSYAQKVLDLVV